MIIKPLGKTLLDTKTGFNLKGRPVGVARASIIITREEREHLESVCNMIWCQIVGVSGVTDFLGHVRFDLVPAFWSKPKLLRQGGKIVFDLGFVHVGGIYEVNAHSPECAAADAAMKSAVPEMEQFCSPASRILAEQIRQIFGNQEILFVQGSGPVKDSWGKIFFNDLKKDRVNLRSISFGEAMRTNGHLIWRWGDARLDNGPSEYPFEFQKWLSGYSGLVFNTMPKSQDISDKRYLMPQKGNSSWNRLVGQNRVLKSQNFPWAIHHRQSLVLKPTKGSSGNNISFGKKKRLISWIICLQKALFQGSYALYEARWLPRVKLPGLGEFALDLNPAFWAIGEKLTYLYTVVRIDHWKSYDQRGTINVAQGGGYGGAIIEKG